MTPKEFADKLRKQLEEFKRVNAPFQLAVYSVVGIAQKRIFEEGKDANGNRFQYKDGWYKQYREKRSRETAFVNWRFEGDLKSDFENAPNPDDTTPNGEPKGAFRIDANHYQTKLSRQINQLKYEGLSKGFTGKKGGRFAGYGEFLNLSKEEEKKFYEIVTFETRKFFAL